MTASEAWPDLAGRLTKAGHEVAVRVYYEDTDFSGFVYHANYLRFMERGRSDFLRLMGISHEALARGALADRPVAFAVRRLSIEYFKPARIDDALVIETAVKEVRGATVVLTQTVRRDGLTLVAAEVLIVVVDSAGKAQRLPAAMRAGLTATIATAPDSGTI